MSLRIAFRTPVEFLDYFKNEGDLLVPVGRYLEVREIRDFKREEREEDKNKACMKVVNLILATIGKYASIAQLTGTLAPRAYVFTDKIMIGGPSGCIFQTRAGMETNIKYLLASMPLLRVSELELPSKEMITFLGTARMSSHTQSSFIDWLNSASPARYRVEVSMGDNTEIGRRIAVLEEGREDLIVRAGFVKIRICRIPREA